MSKDYITQLNEKLEAARIRVRQGAEAKNLKAAAPSLFEIIDTEISLAVNGMTQDKPAPYEEYLSLHGQVIGIRKIRNLLDSRAAEEVAASQEVEAIRDNLKNIENDQKQ